MSIQNISLNTSIILTGLSAGLFYAWSVSVIPGTQKIDDLAYLSSMQSINRAILNPAFFLIFFGSLIAIVIATYFSYAVSKTSFLLLVIATLTYLIGTIGVTLFGNVPLNNQLDVLHLGELGAQKMAEFRQNYELRWNRLHSIRMVFSVLSFIMALLALNFPAKN
ncbi:MAG: DUF1772 domain-containing protein [Bacteroidota bacterium]